MKIPTSVYKRWKSLQDHGDITKMANGNESLRVYISKAFSNRECSEEIFQTISSFYKTREEKREKLIRTA